MRAIDERWFVTVGDEELGPLSRPALDELVASGKATRETLVRGEGQTVVIPLVQVEGMFPDSPVRRRRRRRVKPFHPAAGLAKATIGFLALSAALDILGVYADFAQIDLLARARDGASITVAEATANDRFLATVGLAQVGAVIVSGIVFLTWLSRAAHNARWLSDARFRYGTAEAVWCWFVPFLNLVRPPQVISEIWVTSSGDTDGSPGRPFAIGSWWSLWILYGVLGRIAARSMSKAEQLEGMEFIDAAISATYLMALSDGLGLPAAALAIVVVAKISEMQRVGAPT